MIILKPVDRVEVLSVMDNSIDVLMGNTPVARRAQRARDSFSRPQLRAEHGVSMLVTDLRKRQQRFIPLRYGGNHRRCPAQYGCPGSKAQ